MSLARSLSGGSVGLKILGALLAAVGGLIATIGFFIESGYRLVLTASVDGKIGGVYETSKVYRKTTVDLPPGSVRGANHAIETRERAETDEDGTTHRWTEQVMVLRLQGDGLPESLDRDDAEDLARRIQALPRAPAGTRVEFGRELSLLPILLFAGMAAVGGFLLLVSRAHPAPRC